MDASLLWLMIAVHTAQAAIGDRGAPEWPPTRAVTRRRADAIRHVIETAGLFLIGCCETLWIACVIMSAAVAAAPAERVPTRSGWTRALGELALARKNGRRRTDSI